MEHYISLLSVSILPLLFAITVHEAAHGYVAYLLGDPTARILGRLTLNPVKHIDLMGTIIVPIALLMVHAGIIFGWAKPVPINLRNLSKPRRDSLLVALAGPMANFFMAITWAIIIKIGVFLLARNLPGALAIYAMGVVGIQLNLVLMVFNLLPLPPLDGAHIISSLLPSKLAMQYERIASFGLPVLLVLVYFGIVGAIIRPIIAFLYSAIYLIFNLPM